MMTEREPWTASQIALLVLIIAVMIGLVVVGALTLIGSSACACGDEPMFQTINSGLTP
ncbi:MAG: hypothetical protein ACJ8CR_19105 [Roseiflexaceae bacterium]